VDLTFAMNDSPEDDDNRQQAERPATVRLSIPANDRLYTSLTLPPVPDEFIPEFGRVAVVWSDYESALEDLLIALLAATNYTGQRWRGLSYEQRADLFMNKLKDVFTVNCPWVYTFVASTIEGARGLQRDRNLLLHGRLLMRAIRTEYGVETSIIAYGRKKGQELSKSFTVRDLRNLFADIANATSRLRIFSFPKPLLFEMFQNVIPHAALLDIDFLQEFLQNNYPRYSKGPIREDQLPPFQT
jgi:hypothetical protein